jgi:hypothetical protein
MKKVLIVAVLTAVSLAGFSQDKKNDKPLSFTVGVQGDLPIGNIFSEGAFKEKFSDHSSFGIGGYVQGKYSVAENMWLTLHAGYTSFLAKEDSLDNISAIPVLAGFKYNFTEMVFATAQLGVSFLDDGTDNYTAFTYAPGIGVTFSKFDLSLHYTGRSFKLGEEPLKVDANMSSIGLRVGYNF